MVMIVNDYDHSHDNNTSNKNIIVHNDIYKALTIIITLGLLFSFFASPDIVCFHVRSPRSEYNLLVPRAVLFHTLKPGGTPKELPGGLTIRSTI